MSSSIVYHPEEFAASIKAHKEAVKRETKAFLAEMEARREAHRENIAAYIAAAQKFK
jgi:hypothetical protein